MYYRTTNCRNASPREPKTRSQRSITETALEKDLKKHNVRIIARVAEIKAQSTKTLPVFSKVNVPISATPKR